MHTTTKVSKFYDVVKDEVEDSVEKRGQIVAFTSSKGGVGKTHLAIGLSTAMSRRGGRVLLIDADLGNGSVCDRIGFYPKLNLGHFFAKTHTLEDLVEETPYGFFVIGGERGNFSLANLNYLQRKKFLRSFFKIGREFDFVVLDLASGITRQEVDFALLADRTVIVTSPNDFVSAYGSVRACFSRFIQVESRLCKRIEGYKPRRHFIPHILINHVEDLAEGKTAFEALETAVESRLRSQSGRFRVKINYLGAVFHDARSFKKSEERRCPVSTLSVYSKVAFCVDSIASVIMDPSSVANFDKERRIHYTFQMLMERQDRLRREIVQRISRIYPVRIGFHPRGQSASP